MVFEEQTPFEYIHYGTKAISSTDWSKIGHVIIAGFFVCKRMFADASDTS